LMDCAWWGVGGGGPKEVNKGHEGETIAEPVESQKDNLAQFSTFSNKLQLFYMSVLNVKMPNITRTVNIILLQQ
jgi:hypothetical protein